MRATLFKTCLLFLTLNFISLYGQDKGIESSGDIFQIALPVSALTASIFSNEEKNKLIHFGKSFASSIILTHTIKVYIDKERPNGAKDGYSFPSGHTSCAFAGATLLAKQYGWKIGVPAYTIASYVGWTRINAKRHDIFDVLAGAVIGAGSIHFLTKFDNKNLKFTISRLNHRTMVGFVFVF